MTTEDVAKRLIELRKKKLKEEFEYKAKVSIAKKTIVRLMKDPDIKMEFIEIILSRKEHDLVEKGTVEITKEDRTFPLSSKGSKKMDNLKNLVRNLFTYIEQSILEKRIEGKAGEEDQKCKYVLNDGELGSSSLNIEITDGYIKRELQEVMYKSYGIDIEERGGQPISLIFAKDLSPSENIEEQVKKIESTLQDGDQNIKDSKIIGMLK